MNQIKLMALTLLLSFSSYSRAEYTNMKLESLKLLASFSNSQKSQAVYNFNSPQRKTWRYMPSPSKFGSTFLPEHPGLKINQLNKTQRAQLETLLATSMSAKGIDAVHAAFTAERDTSVKRRGVINKMLFKYGPENYFVSFFGTPTDDVWGWRLEGHHIVLNFNVNENGSVTASPSFIGTNPAKIKLDNGRIIQPQNELVVSVGELVKSFDVKQFADASKSVKEVPQFIYFAPGLRGGEFKKPMLDPGLSFAKMNSQQQELVLKILEDYHNHFEEDVATEAIQKIQDAGLNQIEFLWAGDRMMEKEFYFRIQSPNFVLEFSCSEGDADHYHVNWVEF